MLLQKVFTLVVCGLCVGVPLLAQDCHLVLRGRITEAGTHEPLAYATVAIKDAGKGAITDDNGYYLITGLCEGTAYTVEVSHLECAHQARLVQLTENTTVDFQLVHNAVLREVIITEKAVAPPPAQAESTVDRADLAATQGVNLGETLKRLPGVTTLNTGATIAKPVIQGLHSNRIAIVSNNVVLEGQQWGSEHAPEIDPFSADKISVVKGAAGVRYGVGAMAGAVVLEPAPARVEPGVGGWLSLGGFSNGWGGVAAGAVDWHIPGKSLVFRLQGTAKRSGNLRAPDYWLGNTGAAEYDASLLADWKRGRWHHELNAATFNQTIGILRASHIGNLTDLKLAIESDTPRNNRNEFTYDIARPYQSIRHETAKYRIELRLNDKWKLSGQYTFQYNFRREYDVVRQSSSAADKPQLLFQLWTNMADVALEHFPIRHWQGGVGVQGIAQTNNVGKGGLIPDYQLYGGSIWAMERRRRFPDPFEYEIGLRYDYRQTHATTGGSLHNVDTLVQYANLSGTVGMIYHFTKHFDATLHTGYAWRPPSVNELFARGVHHGAGTYEEGRADLLPEKAWNSNFTLQYQDDRWDATVTVYRNQINDFIYLNPLLNDVLTSRGAFPAFVYEQADAVLSGLDGNLSIPIGRQWVAEGRVSLLRGYRLVKDGGEIRHDWLPLMPADRYQYGIRWTINDSRQTASTNGQETYVRLMAMTALRQTLIPAEGLRKAAPPAFTTLSFDAAHTFHLRLTKQSHLEASGLPLEVGLTVQNLLNTRYREYLNFFRYYADETGVNVGLRAKLIF